MMKYILLLLPHLCVPASAGAVWLGDLTASSQNAGPSLLKSFMSYSIELSFFPDFAGNLSGPNEFSYNLLTNIGKLQGSNPIIRVGGSTQDETVFNQSQAQGLVNTWDYKKNQDQPVRMSIGPAFFESYRTWHDEFAFIHGFDLAATGSRGSDMLKSIVPLLCKTLTGSTLGAWQIGNEPDQFRGHGQRPNSWTATSYVQEWNEKKDLIHSLATQHCPDLAGSDKFRFYAPSTSGLRGNPSIGDVWQAGLQRASEVGFFDVHHYVASAKAAGITLQGTLMNHSNTVLSVDPYVSKLASLDSRLPHVFGETNSLYGQGAPQLSNPFGAALWAADFGLYSAAKGIRRIHMHQGTDYRYGSWQPIQTNKGTKGTKAPYYGNIMLAAAVADLTNSGISVQELKQDSVQNSAYAIYVGGRLARVAILQMTAHNDTTSSTVSRGSETFQFRLPSGSPPTRVGVQRLLAAGSDSLSGITFDGYSYNYELNNGKPVLLRNVTRGETLQADDTGTYTIILPWSSAALLQLNE